MDRHWTETPDDGKVFFEETHLPTISSSACSLATHISEIFRVEDGKRDYEAAPGITTHIFKQQRLLAHSESSQKTMWKTGHWRPRGLNQRIAYFPDAGGRNQLSHREQGLSASQHPRGLSRAVQQGAGMMILKFEEKRERARRPLLKWFGRC